MDLAVVGVCINSTKTRLVYAMFVILPSIARSVGYDMKSVRLTEDSIPAIFDKLGNIKFDGETAQKTNTFER